MLVNSQIKKYVTKATKHFPWWDDLKMNCTYGIITLGMLALGTSQALGTFQTCTPCDATYKTCENVNEHQSKHQNTVDYLFSALVLIYAHLLINAQS